MGRLRQHPNPRSKRNGRTLPRRIPAHGIPRHEAHRRTAMEGIRRNRLLPDHADLHLPQGVAVRRHRHRRRVSQYVHGHHRDYRLLLLRQQVQHHADGRPGHHHRGHARVRRTGHQLRRRGLPLARRKFRRDHLQHVLEQGLHHQVYQGIKDSDELRSQSHPADRDAAHRIRLGGGERRGRGVHGVSTVGFGGQAHHIGHVRRRRLDRDCVSQVLFAAFRHERGGG
mmetsp:Transcript_1575/g.2701  ORF Transcript_1575/g.2701 Transcript_1575/m.2701 type:complete len:226 (+) Transcript_1575:152-829(+)